MKKAPIAALALSVALATAAGIWLAGCKPKTAETPAPPQVPADSRSAVTAAVASHLAYGGDFFAVVDIKGGLQSLGDRYADVIQNSMKQAPNNPRPNLDVHALLERTGLYGIEGGGMSSWRSQGDSVHHNAVFLYVPGGRQGLLKISGGGPGLFESPGLAPGDADIAHEATIDLKSLADLITSYVHDVGGPEMSQQLADKMKAPLFGDATVTWQDIIDHANTRTIVIARTDDTQSITINATLKVPFVDALIGLDGFSEVYEKLRPALEKTPFFEFSEKNGMKIATWAFPLPEPWENYKPLLIADPKTKRLYLASRPEFADAVLSGGGSRLDASSDFKTAMSGLPAEGNSLTYISKKAFEAISNTYRQLLGSEIPDEVKTSILASIEVPPHGVGSVTANLPDGILEQDNSNQSNKKAIMAVPIAMTGLMATIAIPAISAARAKAAISQNSAMQGGGAAQDAAIRSNLRLLANTAQQYMLDNNVTVVRYADLVGGAGKPIARVVPIAGESYENIVIRQNTRQISVETADGHTVTYNL